MESDHISMSTNGCKGIRPKLYSKVEFRTQPLVDIYNFTPVLSIVNQSITDNSVEVRSNKKTTKSKPRKNQNLFIVNQSITSNSLEVRSRPRPTRYTTPTSHFLKNFLKNNVQTIPIISNYHLCLVQNGTTFPQGATKPLSELCHPLQ